MTNEQKQQVKNALVRYAIGYPTQADAASSLSGISATTISLVKNNKWDLVSNQMWHTIARQVGYYSPTWRTADTSTYLLLHVLLGDAQNYAMHYGIAIAKGLGKTFTAARYKQEHENVCYLACHSNFTRRAFITALLATEGLTAKGSVEEMIKTFTDHIADKPLPLLLLDDADQLKDGVIHLVVSITNHLAGLAGVVLLGGKALRPRIIDGARLKKAGFDAIYQSIGKRFITLNELGNNDIELVCNANGVHDKDLVQYIQTESKGNLHNTTRLIEQTCTENKAA